jgi:hypothetical protein
MTTVLWYSEASLIAEDRHIFCAGSLAQCVRKWRSLPTDAQTSSFIRQGASFQPTGMLNAEAIAALAANPELTKV